MSRCILRFLHAADFQLHRLPAGVAKLPQQLHQVLIDAPLEAARNVFDAALANAVDFVVLSGGIIDVDESSPLALRFLVEQFQRLNEKNIRVYWAGGPRDLPGKWPGGLPLPDNVHVFTTDKVESLSFVCDGKPLAAITGMSNSRDRVRASDFRAGRDGVFTLGVAAGEATVEELSSRGVGYWALGGREQPATVAETPVVIRYAGSPQGFSPAAVGKHGATLVTVDDANEVRTQALACDVFRWQNEQLTATTATSDEELFVMLSERTTQLISGAPDKHQLIRWSMVVDDHLGQQLRHEGLGDELQSRLQQHFANRKPSVWTYELTTQANDNVPAELYEEDTILGDFLRSLREFRTSKGRSLDLETMLANEIHDADAAAAIRAEDTGRDQLLRDVAALGVEMLSGAAGSDSNAAKIQFRGGGDNGPGGTSMTLKHDGESWQAQQDMAAMLDEELAT